MLKKVSGFILIFILFINVTAFAGDIPESIMAGKQKALFIGEIISIKGDEVTITPNTIMMGRVEGSELKIKKFDKYYGTNNKPKAGDFIVAVLLEENKIDDLWVFKCTSKDYKTLKLVSEPYDMVVRYEEYINEGKYFEAQKKLDDKAKEEATATKAKVKSGEVKEISPKGEPHKSRYVVIGVVFIVALGLLIKAIRR